jgi:hypothetical protein
LMCEECLKEHQIGCFAKGRWMRWLT